MDNETALFLVVIFLIGFIALGIYLEKRKKARFLRNIVPELGVLTNYTYSQLVYYIGSPNSVQYIDGGKLCVWQEQETSLWSWGVTGIYTIALIFDINDHCLGISSETYI